MAESQAMIGYGGKVYVENTGTSPFEFEELDEIVNMTPPQDEADDVDVTHMQSPNRTREFKPGLIDPGDAGFECNWIPGSATDATLLALKRDGTVVTWRFQWPNGTYWDFEGYVKGYQLTAENEDKLTATVSIKVSGSATPSYAI